MKWGRTLDLPGPTGKDASYPTGVALSADGKRAWVCLSRNNALAVQQLLDDEYVVVDHEKFRLQLHRDDAEVLQTYLMPFQLHAAEVLGAKYSWQPSQPTKIEVPGGDADRGSIKIKDQKIAAYGSSCRGFL